MHFWLEVSTTAAWVRLPSAIGAAAAVGFVFLLGRRLAGTSVGVAAGLVLIALPFSARFAQEARPYALVMGCATAASWLLVRAIDDGRRRSWSWYAVLVVGAVALHLFAITLILAHLATCAITYRGHWRRYQSWLISVLPAVAVAAFTAVLTAENSTSHAWIPTPTSSTPYALLLDFAGSTSARWLLLAVVVVGGLCGARSAGAGKSSRRPGLLAVAVPWLILPASQLIAASSFEPVFVPRYVLFSLPALALLVGGGIIQIGRAVRWPALRAVLTLVGVAMLVATVAAPQAALRRLDSHSDDPKAEAAYLLSVSEPGDGVVYSPRDLVHSLVPDGRNRLPTDALLARTAVASATLNGIEVSAADASRALLRFSTLWVLEIPGLEDAGPLSIATGAVLAAHYRLTSTTFVHGVDVVRYERVTS
jgi:mannosyltransferase